MKYKDIEIVWLGHAGFKLKSREGLIVYIDPFRISEEAFSEKADFIFITHSHYDHCSIEDIKKIVKPETIIICTPDCQSKFRHIGIEVHTKNLEPEAMLEFETEEGDLKAWAVRAYNLKKTFHTREEDWLGYIIQLNGVLVYHAGDTDLIPEMKQIKEIDIALLPIGGTYTMNAGEAAKAASLIKPKLAIPMHYLGIEGVGTRGDADLFLKYCSQEGIEVKVLEVEK